MSITDYCGVLMMLALLAILVSGAFSLSKHEIGSPEYKSVLTKFWRATTFLVIFFFGFFLGQITLALDIAFDYLRSHG